MFYIMFQLTYPQVHCKLELKKKLELFGVFLPIFSAPELKVRGQVQLIFLK